MPNVSRERLQVQSRFTESSRRLVSLSLYLAGRAAGTAQARARQRPMLAPPLPDTGPASPACSVTGPGGIPPPGSVSPPPPANGTGAR